MANTTGTLAGDLKKWGARNRAAKSRKQSPAFTWREPAIVLAFAAAAYIVLPDFTAKPTPSGTPQTSDKRMAKTAFRPEASASQISYLKPRQ